MVISENFINALYSKDIGHPGSINIAFFTNDLSAKGQAKSKT